MTRKNLWRGVDGSWRYPYLAVVMVEVGLEEVETYVARHQNMFIQYIATHLIMDLCLETDRYPGARVSKWWC